MHDLSAAAQGLFENRQAKLTVNPHLFLEGVNQLLFMAQQIDNGEAENPSKVFDEFTSLLSQDAPQFFAEGMQEV